MEIKMYTEAINQFPYKERKFFDIRESEVHWTGYDVLDVSKFGIRQLKKLVSILEKMDDEYKKIFSQITLLKGYIEIISDPTHSTKLRMLVDFRPALQNYLLDFGHRIHRRVDPESNHHDCYVVTDVEYYPRRKDSNGYWIPEEVQMNFAYEKIGQRYHDSITFYADDVVRKTVPEILLRAGYIKETKKLRNQYLQYYDRYQDVIKMIGTQFVASGEGITDVPSDFGDSDDRYYSGKDTFKFSGTDKVVIDVFRDEEKEFEPRKIDLNTYQWAKLRKRTGVKRRDLEDSSNTWGDGRCTDCDEKGRNCKCVEDVYDEEVRDEDGFQEVNEVPVHTYCVVFDLQRHLRLSVHVGGLNEYEFDIKLHEKLVLPENIKELVRMLIKHKEGNFIDIIKGKSGGAILLLTGRAGVGKTLTAEVFAEASSKPLYNIQASQLGIQADKIELKLRRFIRRASRWDAIMLIDEADVYIHERGNDLEQNAIVGVLLRVLEYHTATMFLTTNRPDLIDDAIASRCVARIDYKPPTPEEQKKIWKILSDMASIKVSSKEISDFVDENHDFSGRDIKNILKLANLQSLATGEPITSKSIKYISQFNSTTVKKESMKND